jgi:hypothetical protein
MHKVKTFSVLMLSAALSLGMGSVLADNHKKAMADTAKVAMKKMDPQAAKAAEAIKMADAARKKAGSVKGEWRDTGSMIKSAQEAADAGKYDEAIKLANKAKMQGERGYEQAVAQKELRMPAYIKY